MKRVAINLFAAHKVQTGIGTYLTGLIDGFSKIDLKIEPVLIINNEGKEIFQKYLKHFEYYLAPKITNTIQGRVFYEHLCLKKDLKKLNIALLHSPVFVTPMNYKGKGILTIHDTTFITHPQYHIPSKRAYFKWGIPMSVKKNNKVIAISENTKKDLIKLFPKYKNKFAYIPYGLKNIFFDKIKQSDIEMFKKNLNLPKKYFLYVGVLEPKKNIIGILKAFKSIQKDHKDLYFVIAGRKGWYYSSIFKAIKELNLTENVIYPGHIEYEQLPLLYQAAMFFIYPSFYEGFGMPVLEAMASRCPVITSGISSTKEVAKDGALFVDPQSIDDIAMSMKSLLTDEKLKTNIIQKGEKRALEFSWERTAAITQDLYMEVLNG
ncbi:glycosyltransferase family 4 protein, partial [bacterium]|nr:glycosyltransferase family 4 protein [bacterium]